MTNVIRISEAAKKKKVARTTIYEWIKRGLVNTEEILGKQVILRDEKFENLKPARWSRIENINWSKIQNYIEQEVENKTNKMNRDKILWAINQMPTIKKLSPAPVKVGTQFYDVVFQILLIGQDKPLEIKRVMAGEHGFVSMDDGSVVFYDHISKIEFSHFLSSHHN